MKAQLLTSAICLIFAITTSVGQDAEFTQFYANPVYLNPAFAGSVKCPRIVLNYRNQWAGIDEGFQTYSASYDQYVNALSGGVALQLLKDGGAGGTYNSTVANITYARHTIINRKLSFSAGMKAGYLQRSVALSEFTYGDQIDKADGVVRSSMEAIGTESRSRADVSAGVMLYSKRLFMGMVAHHILQPKIGLITDSRLKRRYTFHSGIHIPLNEEGSSNVSISPNLLLTHQGNFTQINAGVYVTRGVITGGIWYRNKDAMIVLVGIDDTHYKLGYSYDITLSGLDNVSGGTHELSFTYRLPCRPKKIKYKGEKCKKMGPDKGKMKYTPVQCPSF